MGSVKGELEDLAFLYLEPEEHERVAREVARKMKVSEGDGLATSAAGSKRACPTPAIAGRGVGPHEALLLDLARR